MDWKDRASAYQQAVHDLIGDRKYDCVDMYNGELLKKVIVAMYGLPKGDDFERYFGYSEEQYDEAKVVKKRIIQESKGDNQKILIKVVYIAVKLKDTDDASCICIFGIPKDENPGYSDSIFFEVNSSRKYNGWIDYLENNKLPKCDMCYPKYGEYRSDEQGKVILEFRESPACNILTRITDFTTEVTSGAGSVTIAASFLFPVTTPFIVAAEALILVSGGISAIRGFYKIADRYNHGESISLDNKEAGLIYIESILGGLSSISSAVVLSQLARQLSRNLEVTSAEINLGSKTQIFLNVLRVIECSSLAVNVCGISASIVYITLKYIKGELQTSDLQKVILGVLFFANMEICMDTARKVIQGFTSPDAKPFQMTRHARFSTVKCIRKLCKELQPVVEVMINGIPEILELYFKDSPDNKLLIETAINITKLLLGRMSWYEFTYEILPNILEIQKLILEYVRRITNAFSDYANNEYSIAINTCFKKIETNCVESGPSVKISDKEFYIDTFYGTELNERYCMDRVKLITGNDECLDHYCFELCPSFDISKAVILIKDNCETNVFIFFYNRTRVDNVFIMKAKGPRDIKMEMFEDIKIEKMDVAEVKQLPKTVQNYKDKYLLPSNSTNTNLLEVESKNANKHKATIDEKRITVDSGSVIGGEEKCTLMLENVDQLSELYLESLCKEFGELRSFSMGESSAFVTYCYPHDAQDAFKGLNSLNKISTTLVG